MLRVLELRLQLSMLPLMIHLLLCGHLLMVLNQGRKSGNTCLGLPFRSQSAKRVGITSIQ